MTEEQEAAAGEHLIEFLYLPKIRSGPDKGRVRTAWGTKTPLGLYRTIHRMMEELSHVKA